MVPRPHHAPSPCATHTHTTHPHGSHTTTNTKSCAPLTHYAPSHTVTNPLPKVTAAPLSFRAVKMSYGLRASSTRLGSWAKRIIK